MVKLEAKIEGDNVIISQNDFEHLLNCLANQRFVGEPPQNGDSIAEGKEGYDKVQNEIQDAIDDFSGQCRKLLSDHNPCSDNEPVQSKKNLRAYQSAKQACRELDNKIKEDAEE